ncbi:hypothetical protein ACWGJX_47260 [Streptomyces sp. NPDC054775]
MTLEVGVVLLAVVLSLTWAARRLHVSELVLLLVGGILLALVPRFQHVGLPPDLVLLVFLPPLLYAESLTMGPSP